MIFNIFYKSWTYQKCKT